MDRRRLANAVVSRRVQLGHRTREAFAEASGLSHRTLSYIEKADERTYSASTVAQLEHALKWSPGSVTTILSGGDPIPTDVRPEPLPAVFAGLIRAHRELPADEWAAVETILQGVVSFAESRIAAAKRGRA